MPKGKPTKPKAKPKAAPKKQRASNCKIIIDEAFLKKVEAMAANGNTQEQIAWNLGISPETLSRKKGADEQLNQAIKRGRAKGIAQVSNQLFQEASKTEHRNITAILFYLCNRDPENWKHVSKAGEDKEKDDDKLTQVLAALIAKLPD